MTTHYTVDDLRDALGFGEPRSDRTIDPERAPE